MKGYLKGRSLDRTSHRETVPDMTSERGLEFIKSFLLDLRPHVAYPTHLLGQAARAFDGASALGTSILCRAALEAMYVWFLQWTTGPKGAVEQIRGPDGPTLLPGQKKPGDNVSFGPIMNLIRERGVLSEAQLGASDRIRRNGNWVAHMIQVTDRDRRKSSNPLDWTPWITDREAWADFEDTADILRTFEDALPSIYR